MNLHEYQSKELFSFYGMPVPPSQVAASARQARAAAVALGGQQWVVKAQVHAGGRGKAGGVKMAGSVDEVEQVAAAMLGTRLMTFQTTAQGQPVNQVLVEVVSTIRRELYLGAVIDRAAQRLVVMASTEGGVNIEEVATHHPEKIHRIAVHPVTGLMPWQARQLGFALQLDGDGIKSFASLLTGMVRLFVEKDLSLTEINPLIVTREGGLCCLDGKINIDDNALHRHADLLKLRDESQEDERELQASRWDLSYVSLDGSIGCMVNGAGLAMATMDVIKLKGGNPANFLDVGGAATAERVAEAFRIITSDANVKGILVNIFGGIVRCDLIAQGIVAAAQTVRLDIPVVVRLEGNRAEAGMSMLKQSGLALIPAGNLDEAAEEIVNRAGMQK